MPLFVLLTEDLFGESSLITAFIAQRKWWEILIFLAFVVLWSIVSNHRNGRS